MLNFQDFRSQTVALEDKNLETSLEYEENGSSDVDALYGGHSILMLV